MKKIGKMSIVALSALLLTLSGCAKNKLNESAGLDALNNASAAAEGMEINPQPVAVVDESAVTDNQSEPEVYLETIYFDFDSYILSAPAREALIRNSQWLKQNPDQKLVLEGYADERGSDEYNLALGQNRAKAVYEYLNQLTSQASQCDIVSYGEEKPAVPGHDEISYAQNRRVEFRVVKQKVAQALN